MSTSQQKTIDRALAHHKAGEMEQAISLYRQVLRAEPMNSKVLDYLAQALQLMCRLEEALYARQLAVKAEPGNLFLRDHLASLLVDMAEPEKSVEVWRDLVLISGNNPVAELWLAKQLMRTRHVPEAMEILDRMVAARPDDVVATLECAVLNERLGNIDRAKSLIQEVLNRHPEHPEANTAMGRLLTNTGDLQEARKRLEFAVNLPKGKNTGRSYAVLAQALDKLKEHDAAFEAASIAQKTQFDALLSQDKNLPMQEKMILMAQELTREQIEQWPGLPPGPSLPPGVPAPPVFVVGFPRSGTTLIEQMLSAHPNLTVSDELPNLQAVRQKIYADIRKTGRYPTDLGEFTPKQVGMARRWYFERAYKTVPEAGGPLGNPPGPRKRIVDKQPLNTIEMCFARLIFPDSPMIYVQRDPRDTVVSVFMQGFTQAVPHLFSLEGTARLYHLFAQTWRHYEKVLGARTMRLKYEDLVEDAEREARRMIEFIGEPWSDSVMNYYAPEHRRLITTPSYADVAKPVYRRAMGRWRKYEKQLQPVLPVLEEWVAEAGYEPSNAPRS